jgi:hypothetical protein
MAYYRDKGVIKYDAELEELDISLGGEIIEGVFIDVEKPTFSDILATVSG